ncbi:MAG: HIT domain-containing protein [Xanthobacteraceae bacterium]|nr:HIT domain-containing protein [Xanthobacteraceae bacterium]QYK45295.1 MAG: HIT domain-containing protein [Xanthobacteraceae bacterium]
MDFSLDPRLEADSLLVGDLALTQVRLHNDARFPWLVLIPRRPNLAEIFDLSETERATLTQEVSACGAELRAVTQCDKINVGALGNLVRQLHVHVVARFERDPAWPGPVWGFGTRTPYAAETSADLIARLRSALAMRA